MDASKITVSDKTYDLNHLGKKKKTNLRRKVIVEYIQSKPSGELISFGELQEVAQFNSYPTAYSFIGRMVRDGIISKYPGEKPKTYYYGVLGAVRVHKTEKVTEGDSHEVTRSHLPDINGFVKSMSELGVKFTITIESKP